VRRAGSTNSVLGVDDLTPLDLDRIMRRAADHLDSDVVLVRGAGPIVGSVFLETSLRTRVGFAVAATRLGGSSVEVGALRSSEISMPESLEDTLRVVAGMVDVLVVRVDRALRPLVGVALPVPVINAGDRGPSAEHPTQALIDLFAIERLKGPVGKQIVGICGDLRMRSARSFLRVLAHRPPGRLVLLTDSTFNSFDLPDTLVPIAEKRSLADVSDLDVISVVGIAHGSASEDVRTRLRLDTKALSSLPAHAIILSPMPVIDEVEPTVRADPRWRAFEQSDLATPVRVAILEHALGIPTHS
jgi:aspartate carbamoyltransferase catalytic subunit